MESLLNQHWHQIPGGEVAELLGCNPETGLTDQEVGRRQARFGPNRVTAKKERGPLVRFLLQFHQPLVYILLGAVVVTGIMKEWVDALVILGVVLINAVVGFLQEARAARMIEALARSVTTEAVVRRGGQRRRVPSAELVPGDVVLVQSGDKVPADLRLLSARELRVSEAALTGESVPVEKQFGPLSGEQPLADRTNMLYSSGLVTYGQGVGIVVATGDRTEIGRVSQLIADATELATPLTRQIARFSALLLYAILVLAGATFAVGLLRGEPAIDMFLAAVALTVGAIPEGLPAAVTITLAIGVSRMAARRAIIRRLPAVETLGSTTVICSDKTGTLTENQMTVQRIVAGRRLFDVSGAGYAPEGQLTSDGGASAIADSTPPLVETLRAGLLCNDAVLSQKDGRWQVEGDPTEGALLVSAAKGGLDRSGAHEGWPRLDAIPFESEYQYMATLHRIPGGDGTVAYVKGAAEAILARCGDALDETGAVVPLDRAAIVGRLDELAGQALRVLAFARKSFPASQASIAHADVDGGLTFVGLQGMIDPPRPESVTAVADCHRAGIAVKMITGDHAVTASAIARQIGLVGDGALGSPRGPLTGRDLEALSSDGLAGAVEQTAVFARVSPEQKLQLVEALQSRGHVVAMTGDGVNDGPALKRADIGVAMGRSGTEVAKEAADMVLTDDNFASIQAAVEEGRGVFDNLTKFITWTLPTNLGEALVILVAIFAGATLPITPLQVLWINMTTAVLLGLMLAFEPKEAGIMDRPPRDPSAPILTRVLMRRIVVVGVLLLGSAFSLFEIEQYMGRPLEEARAVAVTAFVLGELFYLFACRSLRAPAFGTGFWSNPWVFGGAALMLLLQGLFVYLPAMNRVFGSAPISVASWLGILAWSAGILAVIEVEKWIGRRARGAAAR